MLCGSVWCRPCGPAASGGGGGALAPGALEQPEYQMEEGAGSLEVHICMPRISSAAEADVTVGLRSLKVVAKGLYELQVGAGMGRWFTCSCFTWKLF